MIYLKQGITSRILSYFKYTGQKSSNMKYTFGTEKHDGKAKEVILYLNG